MALDGIIFDVDGTLVDTNALHVEAFVRAFASHGYKILPDRIAVEIGKGGDNLIPSILGKSAEEKDGEAIREQEPGEFHQLAAQRRIPVFPGVRELFAELRRRRIKIIVASSSGEKQLATIKEFSGLDVVAEADVLVNGDEVSSSKPAPDLVAMAVKKSGLSPAQCAMIGDTPWDAESARKAGVICLGLETGGNAVEVLMNAGARRVYADIAELAGQLDAALAVASPGSLHLTTQRANELMEHALDVARQGMAAGEVPIGACLANGDGVVIARGWNRLIATGNKTAHAEMVMFADSGGKIPLEARDLILISSLEPCVMCTGAAMEAAVDTILFALRAPADSGSMRVTPPRSPESQMPRIVGDIQGEKSLQLFKQWLAKNPRATQTPFVRQLLELHKAI